MDSSLTGAQLPPVVIIGLDSLPGIQAARILAGHGLQVLAIARNPDHYCCRTNVCQRILYADTQSDSFVETLTELGPDLPQKAVLIPCTDMSVWMLSLHRQLLEPWYRIMLPDHDVVTTLMDKLKFYAYAQREGLAIPRTELLNDRADAEKAAGTIAYPCIVKPALRTANWTKYSRQKVYKVSSQAEFFDVYDRFARWTDGLIVQEWIPGPDANLFSCNCYFNASGRPLVTFVARKLRQWPPQAGISCLGQECNNDEVLEETMRLFSQIGYRGLGYLEMKRDQRTGRHYILEANIGRPTVRSAIAEGGGVALLYAAYCDATGRPLPPDLGQQYRAVKWIHLHYDLRSAFHYWRRGELTLSQWRRSLRGPKVYALHSWQDPAPFWYDLKASAGRLIARNKKSET